MFSLSIIFPLDYSRVRRANYLKKQYENEKNNKRYFNRVYGIYDMYKGFGICCIGVMIYRGLYFGLYYFFKPVLYEFQYSSFLGLFILR